MYKMTLLSMLLLTYQTVYLAKHLITTCHYLAITYIVYLATAYLVYLAANYLALAIFPKNAYVPTKLKMKKRQNQITYHEETHTQAIIYLSLIHI